MRLDSAGRIGVLFAVLLSIAVPCALLIHSRATAYLDSQAARAAVAQALATLPTAPVQAPAATSGVPANEGQRQQLMKVADAYRKLLSEADYSGAWELVDPDSVGEWTRDAWLTHMAENTPDEAGAEGIAALLFFFRAKSREVVEVATRGDSGLAHVAIHVEWPIDLAFTGAADEWSIDLRGSERLAAMDQVQTQFEQASTGSMFDLFAGPAMFGAGQGIAGRLLTQGAIKLEDEKTEVLSATTDGDRAQLRLRHSGTAHVVVPLAMQGGRWRLQPTGELKAVESGVDLQAMMADGVAGQDPDETCKENLRALAMGMLMYQQDYDGKMPIADRWCDGVQAYVPNMTVFTCPADDGEYSYAMNYKLSRLHEAKIEFASSTITLFESEPSRKNAWDGKEAFPGTSIADPPRHKGHNNFAWADGHVSSLLPEEVKADQYRPFGRSGEAAPPPGGGEGVAWMVDYSKGMGKARGEGKPVMIDLYADWCGPCRSLDEKTWSDPKVRELSKSFVCIKVNVDEDNKTSDLYKVESIPLVVFLAPSGEEIKRNVGFVGPEEMLALMAGALGR